MFTDTRKRKEINKEKRKTMSGLLLTILLLTIFNTVINICVLYYLMNIYCENCKEKMN